jgi:protein-S-isoprenylcysteine O-methyltransferase Ste14
MAAASHPIHWVVVDSIIYTPFVILYNYLVARKEEKELVREFGKQYEDYGKRIPMFRPIIGRR